MLYFFWLIFFLIVMYLKKLRKYIKQKRNHFSLSHFLMIDFEKISHCYFIGKENIPENKTFLFKTSKLIPYLFFFFFKQLSSSWLFQPVRLLFRISHVCIAYFSAYKGSFVGHRPSPDSWGRNGPLPYWAGPICVRMCADVWHNWITVSHSDS